MALSRDIVNNARLEKDFPMSISVTGIKRYTTIVKKMEDTASKNMYIIISSKSTCQIRTYVLLYKYKPYSGEVRK